jgi:spore maturation protein CgeB
MKILIYGEGYCYGLPLPLKRAMESLGHEVDIFDWTKWLYCSRRPSLKNRIIDRILLPKVAQTINSNFLFALKKNKYDFVLVIKGFHLFSATIAAAKNHVNFIVNWNPDDFFNPRNSSKYLLESFNLYDLIFTGRKHLVEEYYRKGAKKIVTHNGWFYHPGIFYPMQVSPKEMEEYGYDVVFFGSWSKKRVEVLWQIKDLNITIYGAGWHKAPKSFRKKIMFFPPIFTEKLCKVINMSKINLNMLTQENRDRTNVRNFEIPACGGFQLSEGSNEIKELFVEGEEIVCFKSPEELLLKCKYYLEHEEERKLIARKGYERLISGKHTLLDRAKEILTHVSNP